MNSHQSVAVEISPVMFDIPNRSRRGCSLYGTYHTCVIFRPGIYVVWSWHFAWVVLALGISAVLDCLTFNGRKLIRGKSSKREVFGQLNVSRQNLFEISNIAWIVRPQRLEQRALLLATQHNKWQRFSSAGRSSTQKTGSAPSRYLLLYDRGR